MRLGQLARKYSIKQDQMILFLNETNPELSPLHHNSKLSDEIEELVKSRFASPETEEVVEEDSVEINTETIEEIPKIPEIDHDKEL